MSKKEASFDGMGFDDDMDFGSFSMEPKSISQMTKREMAGDASRGVWEGTKSNLADLDKWRDGFRRNLPDSYKSAWNGFDEVTKSVSDLYNQAEKELKPVLGQIAFRLNDLVPDSMERTKGLTGWLKDQLYTAPNNSRGESFEEAMNRSVGVLIGETFAKLEESQEERADEESKERVAKDAIDQKIQADRHDQNVQLFSRMDTNLNKIALYQEKVTNVVQKKMLELSFRKYMVLNQMLQDNREVAKTTKTYLEDLIRASHLPDSAKIRMSDRFKEDAAKRLVGGVNDKVFGQGSALSGLLQRAQRDIKQFMDQTKQSLETAIFAADAMKDGAEMMTGFGQSIPEILGEMVGGTIGDFGRQKILKKIMPEFTKDPKFQRVGEQLRRAFLNPRYGIDKIKETDGYKDLLNGPAGEYLEQLTNYIRDNARPMEQKSKLSNIHSLDGMLDPETATRRVSLSQTDIIPGYLARILNETQAIRIGHGYENNIELLRYNPMNGKFVNESVLKGQIKSYIKGHAAASFNNSTIKNSSQRIATSVGYDKDARAEKVMGELMIELANSTEGANANYILNSDTFKRLDPERQQILRKIANTLKSDTLEGDRLGADIEEELKKIREGMLSFAAPMQKVIDAGGLETLEELNYVKRDGRGNIEQNEKSLNNLHRYGYRRSFVDVSRLQGHEKEAREELLKAQKEAEENKKRAENSIIGKTVHKARISMGLTPEERVAQSAIGGSDVEIKKGFKSFDANYALEGIRKTPVTAWNYKNPAEHGSGEKIGPMAQDLYKNFGGNVAPNGKKIDLISMNGVTMSAIQALDKKVSGITEGVTQGKTAETVRPDALGHFRVSGKRNQINLLHVLNENVISMHKTLDGKTFGIGIPDLQNLINLQMPKMDELISSIKGMGGRGMEMATEAKNNLMNNARPLIETGNYYIDSLQSLAVKSLNDVFQLSREGYHKGKQLGKDYIVDPAKTFWVNNNAEIKRKRDWLFDQVISLSGNALEFGRKTLFETVPQAFTSGFNKLKVIKEHAKSIFSGPRDVFRANDTEPLLRAKRMRAGMYANSRTGEIIRSIDTLLKCQDPIVDIGYNNEVVLTPSDIADGLYDQEGNELTTLATTITGIAAGAVKTGLNFAKNKLGDLKQWWDEPSKFMDTIRGAFDGFMEKFSIGGLSFYDKREIGLLVQIRDLIAIGKKQKLVESIYNRDLKDDKNVSGNSYLSLLYGNKFKGLTGQAEEALTSGGATSTTTESSGSEQSSYASNTGSDGPLGSIARGIEKAKAFADYASVGIAGSKNFVGPMQPNQRRGIRSLLGEGKAGQTFDKLQEKFKIADLKYGISKKHRQMYDEVRQIGEKFTLENGKSFILGSDRLWHDYDENNPDEHLQPIPEEVVAPKTSFKDRMKTGWGNLKQNVRSLRYGPTDEIVSDTENGFITRNANGIYTEHGNDKLRVTWADKLKAGKNKLSGMKDQYDRWSNERLMARMLAGDLTPEEMEGIDGKFQGFGDIGQGLKDRYSEAKGMFGRVKDAGLARAGAFYDNLKDKASPHIEDTKDRLGVVKDKFKESGDQAVQLVSKLAKNPAFSTLMKGLVGFKEAYVGEASIGGNVKNPSYADRMMSALGVANAGSRMERNANENAASGWGRFKTNMQERFGGVAENVRGRIGGMKSRWGERLTAAKEFGGRMLENVKGFGSGIGGMLDGLFGSGDREEATGNQHVGTAFSNPIAERSGVRGLGDGVKGVNDHDGDGERDGGATEQLKRQMEEEKARKTVENQKAQEAAKRAQDSSLKYKSRENAIDKMIKGASTLIGSMAGGVGSLLSFGMDVLGTIPGLGRLAAGLFKGLKFPIKGAGGALKAGARFLGGKAVMGAGALKAGFAAGGVKGALAAAVGGAKASLTAASAASLATGSITGSVAAGALSVAKMGLLALASPLLWKVAAVAAVGYGVYRLAKYMTRNNADNFEKLRLVQYGLEEKHEEQHRILALESYLLDGRLSFSKDGVKFNTQAIKNEELLEIFDISPDDKERIEIFYIWLNERFRPFFTNQVTALYRIDPKMKLTQLNKLKHAELQRFLDTATMADGPYDITESPFATDGVMANTKDLVPKLITALRASKKPEKGAKGSNADAVTNDPKTLAAVAARKAEEEEARRKAQLPAGKTEEALKENKGASKPTGKPELPQSLRGEDAGPPRSVTAAGGAGGVLGASVLPVASGPLASPDEGRQFIVLNNKKVNLDGLNPLIRRNLLAMAAEYGKKAGRKIVMTDGFRSYEEQAALHARKPHLAAAPGNSMHEFGLAFDIDSKNANELEKLGLLRKYGFTRPIGGEAWHLEPAGLQLDIKRAKADKAWADEMIKASVGRGGGGYGTMVGSKEKRRNPNIARAVFEDSGSSVVSTKENTGTDTAALAPKLHGSQVVETKPSAGAQNAANDPKYAFKPELVKTASTPLSGKTNEGGVSGKPAVSFDPTAEGEPTPSVASIPKTGNVVEDTKKAAAEAAKKTGMEPSVLQLFAAAESSMGQRLNSGSSAQGPFQFMPKTWDEQVRMHGAKYGISANDSPMDPYASGVMTSAYLKQNEARIKKFKSNPDIVDYYLSHMLGGGGVSTFLRMRPQDYPAVMMPKAARSNPNVFFRDPKTMKNPYTQAEIRQNLVAKFKKLSQDFGINVGNLSSPLTSLDSGVGGSSVSGNTPAVSEAPQFAAAGGSQGSVRPQKESVPVFEPTPLPPVKSNPVETVKPTETARPDIGLLSGVSEAIGIGNEHAAAIVESLTTDIAPTLREIRDILGNMYGTKTEEKGPEPKSSVEPSKGGRTLNANASVLDRQRRFG